MNQKRTLTNHTNQDSLSNRLDSVGVQTFNFAFFPEGEAMVQYNQRSIKAHATRFTSPKRWQEGSSINILNEFLELVHPEDSDLLTAYVNQHLSYSISGQVTEVPQPFSTSCFRARETELEPYRWFELRSHLYLEVDLGVIICEGCFLDITELRLREQLLEEQKVRLESEISERRNAQKRLEETLNDLKKAQEALLVKTKLEALGNLASGVAHDFRNLLMPIFFYNDELNTKLSTLQSQVNPDSELFTELFTDLFACVERIETSVIDSLELISKLKSEYRPSDTLVVNRSMVNLHRIVMDAWFLSLPHWKLERVSPEIKNHIPHDIQLFVAESELRQALTNIMINSLYALEQRYAQEPKAKLLIKSFVKVEASELSLTIQDFGVGMSESVLAHCRNSFFSTKGQNGSGLGLYMVSKSIRALNGNLEIRSEEGVGTSICLKLPINL